MNDTSQRQGGGERNVRTRASWRHCAYLPTVRSVKRSCGSSVSAPGCHKPTSPSCRPNLEWLSPALGRSQCGQTGDHNDRRTASRRRPHRASRTRGFSVQYLLRGALGVAIWPAGAPRSWERTQLSQKGSYRARWASLCRCVVVSLWSLARARACTRESAMSAGTPAQATASTQTHTLAMATVNAN